MKLMLASLIAFLCGCASQPTTVKRALPPLPPRMAKPMPPPSIPKTITKSIIPAPARTLTLHWQYKLIDWSTDLRFVVESKTNLWHDMWETLADMPATSYFVEQGWDTIDCEFNLPNLGQTRCFRVGATKTSTLNGK